jgi:hypothetical protein
MNKPFFLAKAGQTYGPFDRNEIEALRESGEYEKYTWFWDQSMARWAPIDPPPGPPVALAEHQATFSSIVPDTRLKSVSVICHDHQNVVSGTLANVTDAGCEFVVSSHSSSPDFQSQLPILMHLLDLKSGQSMNVSGKLGRIERRSGNWVYRIHWKRCPELLNDKGSLSKREASL